MSVKKCPLKMIGSRNDVECDRECAWYRQGPVGTPGICAVADYVEWVARYIHSQLQQAAAQGPGPRILRVEPAPPTPT